MLAGVGRKLMHRHAQPEGGVGLQEHIRTGKGDAIEIGRQQRVEQLGQRGGFPSALGDQGGAHWRAPAHALHISGQVGEVLRSSWRSARTAPEAARTDCRSGGAARGSSSSWRWSSWRRWIAPAITLATATRNDTSYSRELAPLAGVRAQHAIGAAVASCDRCCDAADHLVFMQQWRAGESRFAGEIVDHDRGRRVGQREAGLRVRGRLTTWAAADQARASSPRPRAATTRRRRA